MEPLTTGAALGAAGALVLDQAKSEVVDFIKRKVIVRWSDHRSNQFLSTFFDEVRKEQEVKWPSADLNDMLQAIARSDKKTSVLFEAYRHVALSASKDMGPMIIGLLTAEIVLSDRDATDDDELLFEAAETLKDRDFEALDSWLEFEYARHQDPLLDEKDLVVVAKTGPTLTGGVSMSQLAAGDQSPLDIAKDVGSFALKLKQLGLVTESVSRRTPGQPGADQYLVSVSPACRRLHRLSQRAMQVVPRR